MSDRSQKQISTTPSSRRRFIRQCAIGGCGAALGAYTFWDLAVEGADSGLRVGFRNDAPKELGKWSREAMWYEVSGSGVSAKAYCTLCPHECILGENDRGFCKTRVVKNQKLHTLAYGNPCAIHLDPVEKKPLNHFLPGTSIFSIATAGCNLRCKNCQNWDISQSRPEETTNSDFPPDHLVQVVSNKHIPSIAYTYSEPIIFYEYVYETALRAKKHNIKNVLVTAAYISPKPLKQLCRVIDAANVDLKGFNEYFYKKVTGGKLAPVLDALQIMKQEGVWLEITRLIVPTLSDDIGDIRSMAKWITANLGPDTPLHISRFHPAYQLKALPPTPVSTLLAAKEAAHDAGLRHVYVGNVPLKHSTDTLCPDCGEVAIKRRGYKILENNLKDGRCTCGERLAGVWT